MRSAKHAGFLAGTALLAAASSIAFADPPATQPANAKCQFAILQDTRYNKAGLTEQELMSDSETELRLFLSGPDAAAASAYNVHIDIATDDAGGNLARQDQTKQMEGISDVYRDKLKSDGTAGFIAQCNIDSSKRSATRLTEVKGVVTLQTGGENKTAEFTNLASLSGKDLTDPILKAAGLQFHVTTAGGREVKVKYLGKTTDVRKIELVNDKGDDIGGNHSGFGFGEVHEDSYDLDADLAAGDKLKITVAAGQHTVQVPFDLKDIKLP